MSVVTLQFGQCGNQIGQALFSDLYNDIKGSDASKMSIGKRSNVEYVAEAVSKWFHVDRHGQWEARSILVDTENKVAAVANNNVPYKFKNVVAKSHGGAANNWAYGYFSKSKLLMPDVVDAVRNQMEKCDFVSSVLSILGSAGGTGSGVGSKTLEVLREEYPSKTIVNAVILPYASGEVVTQNYNTLLTLAKLYDITDATFLYENDSVHKMCTKTLSLTNVTFRDINEIISKELAAVLQPAGNISVSRMVANLAAHPKYKFLQVKSAPHVPKDYLKYEALCSWSMLVNRIRSSMKLTSRSHTDIGRKIKCVGNMLISRGSGSPSDEDIKPFSDASLYVPWLPSQVRLTHYNNNRAFKDINKFLVLSTNNNSVCSILDLVVEDGWTLFTNGAYLHHYKKFSADEEYFSSAFEKVETVLQNYRTL